jgi:hypothetical protein
MLTELAANYGVRTCAATLKARNLRSHALLQRLGFGPVLPQGAPAVSHEVDEIVMYKSFDDNAASGQTALRKQYHFRPSKNGFRAWSVDRLVALARSLPVQRVSLADITEIDEPYWFSEPTAASCREIAEHARLIDEADLSFPIIMSSDRRLMDGMHRVMKALIGGAAAIDAVIFEKDPEPDYVDVYPQDLPY